MARFAASSASRLGAVTTILGPRKLLERVPKAACRRAYKCRASLPRGLPAPSQRPAPAASHSIEATTAAESIPPSVLEYDFLVLGSGIAGLTFALKAAEYGRVAIVTKDAISEGCTQYAQGGICAVLDASDSVEDHVRDTLVAGAFLNDPRAVDVVCREGPAYVLELADFGARFTRTPRGDLHLTREGGHSARRIVHSADATGAEIEQALVTSVRAHPSISIFENHLAVDLVLGEGPDGARLALGADVFKPDDMTMCRFVAPATMLATGGAGQVYPTTTNPSVATGDGMAMAHRAKAAVANMEFVQFHPTALYRPTCPVPVLDSPLSSFNDCRGQNERAFLISEALRGEGALLFNLDGSRFMPGYDVRAELAPRDIVARAIYSEISNGDGATHVLLDISHKPADKIRAHFPTIAAHCASVGVDITKDPIPVVPAQHYMCGGVQTGLEGETTIPGLFACGEVACSGLHGANRLASNSLLEGLVFGNRAVGASLAHAAYVRANAPSALRDAASSADFSGTRAPRTLSQAASAWVAAKRAELTRIMMDAAGIVRHQSRMKNALHSVAELYIEIRALCESYGVNSELVELRNLVTVGELILSSALQRRESRGGHFCLDFPEATPEEARSTVIRTSLGRRLDLGKITAGKAKNVQLFGGMGVPGSPRRANRAQKRELSIAPRSNLEE